MKKSKQPVKCPICEEKFVREYDDNDNPLNFVRYKNRYYHLKCHQQELQNEKERALVQEEKDKLFDFMQQNTSRDINFSFVNKQLTKLLKQGKTITGILFTLKYLCLTRQDFDPYSLSWVEYNYDKAKEYYENQKRFNGQEIKKYGIRTETVVVQKQKNKPRQKWRLD